MRQPSKIYPWGLTIWKIAEFRDYKKVGFSLQAALSLLLIASSITFAQSEAPVPSSSANNNIQIFAPVPGGPVPASPRGAINSGDRKAGYQQLPINANDAQTRLDELKSLMPGAKPQEIQESIYQLCEWLQDIAEGHFRLANSFGKYELTKPQADAERRLAQTFSQLKNQAQLLKADLLIRQQRYPEALGPLIEIAAAEPRSTTGQAAYKRLKDIGFSEELDLKVEPISSLASKANHAKADLESVSAPVGSLTSPSSVAAQRDFKQVIPPAQHCPVMPSPQQQCNHLVSVKSPQRSPATSIQLDRSSNRWLSGTPAGKPTKKDVP